ncbi:hypothetical protein [Dendronalium sp. ChiSLP03b]|uniref:hypothetical protein n=1 Tax=Dendronalium sp. ChiSLP03b TaxID=3075381 RepID=UPI002AD26557|nr:hypothetical protein [Dendronalium sp. ChiSLP03b]MDZ8208418.1 hypothetical protein [Dendronalium sp. ChiSLP03b]
MLTGSTISYLFYSKWGVSTVAIAQIIAFVNFTFWLGMFALSGFLLLAMFAGIVSNVPGGLGVFDIKSG